MPSPYRFAGALLAQAQSGWDVGKQHNGVLELNIDFLVPGAKETLILSLQEFRIPGREMGQGDLPYINGVSRYKTRITPQGNITATFRDFPMRGTRAALNRWFKLGTYDEVTGFSPPEGLVKADGYCVLFQGDGTGERAARLEGLWLVKQPEISVNYNEGAHMVMEVEISCDRVIWESTLDNPV